MLEYKTLNENINFSTKYLAKDVSEEVIRLVKGIRLIFTYLEMLSKNASKRPSICKILENISFDGMNKIKRSISPLNQ